MSKRKLRLHQTQPDVLVSNLRGEVGEVIVTWTLLRAFRAEFHSRRTADPAADMANPDLNAVLILGDKLADEIVARLAELAEPSETTLTFHLAARKLRRFEAEAERFARFVRSNRLKEKRDRDISHKAAPQTWNDRDYLHIPYPTILKAIALAVHLMKKIDRHYLGPASPLLWRKVRTQRYTPMSPPRVGYMLLPEMYLSVQERERVIVAEMEEGRATWEPMRTHIDGQEAVVSVYRKWSGVVLGRCLLVLETYPLNELTSIETRPPHIEPANDAAGRE